MARLSLSLLGPFQATLDGQAVAGFEYNKVRALLAYLAVEADRTHHREVLAELLWPERPTETARANLRKTLSTLRQAIRDEEATAPFLLTTRDTVQFNAVGDHWLDVTAFLGLLDACREHSHRRLEECPPCLQRLAQAVELYAGDFLSQFFLNDSPAFEAWMAGKREGLHRQAMEALARLAAHHESRREYEAALRYARRRAELEPSEEGTHRQLMHLYFRWGQRTAALVQYETCRRILAEELGVEPTEETTALYERIRAAGPAEELLASSARPAAGKRPNPFALRGMIRDPAAFVGRAAELKALFTLLSAMQACSVVGPRRIGKSSLLYHLTHPSVYERHLPDPSPYVFAFVDLQELAGSGPEDLFSTALERLAQASGGRLEGDAAGENTLGGFRNFLRRATGAGLRLVLCCDEFEMLSQHAGGSAPRLFDADFFSYLRGLCSNYNLALVTSSQASLFDLCHQGSIQASQFWNIFTERPLGLMPEDEVRRLIHDLAFTEEDRAFVLSLAGPHPFFLQIACYHVFEARSSGGPPDYEVLATRFFDEARPHYAYAWQRLDEASRQALVALAQPGETAMDPAHFERLKRSALATGSPQAPRLVSAGWRRFITEQATGAP